MPIISNHVSGTLGSDIIDVSGPTVRETRVVSGAGHDLIKLAGVPGVVRAGSGDDTIEANHGRDTVFSEDGNDVILSQGSNDVVFAGAGDDFIDGGGNDDRIFGGDGADTIIGGDGNDIMFGDNSSGRRDGAVGADTFVFDADDGRDIVFDFATGIDTVLLLEDVSFDFHYKAGNTYVTYGDTQIVFIGATLVEDDFTYF